MEIIEQAKHTIIQAEEHCGGKMAVVMVKMFHSVHSQLLRFAVKLDNVVVPVCSNYNVIKHLNKPM